MKKVFDPKQVEADSLASREPRPVGSILNDMFGGWHPNTHLCVNVKTLLRSDTKMKAGKGYQGVLRRDEVCEEFRHEEHFTFHEERLAAAVCKRNPHLFDGQYITVTRRSDGSLRLNFKNLKQDAYENVDNYAFEVYRELRQALKGLIEE
jgi:hypothetical protein